MKRQIGILVGLLIGSALAHAGNIVGNWEPLFKGIEHASGQAVVDGSTPRQLQVQAVRVDLLDPDVELFSTPRATNSPGETLGQNTSLFLQSYGLQVAINANFYSPCCSVPPGTPMNVIGLAISRGVVVSEQEGGEDSSVIMFTSNKVGTIVDYNWPPQGTNGIYTAVAGHYAILLNGVNLGFGTPEANFPNPRTAVGISEDGRYLVMMTIDGRQPGWSDGAVDSETADWLIRFGAYNGLNLDGGGSSTMVKASECDGSAIQLNRPIDRGCPGCERVIGNNFGVYAKPLPNVTSNVVVSPADTTATITWQTPMPAIGQVDYGTTPSYGSASPAEPTPRKNHVVTLNGLSPATPYYFRLNSTVSGTVYTHPCRLTTTAGSATTISLFGISNGWKFTTNNLDGVNWQATNYNDGFWAGPGPGVLYCENNVDVPYKTTPLPSTTNTNGIDGPGTIAPTYYFRTRFNLARTPGAGASLVFSNYIDDGGVFYLNGAEVRRLRMNPAPAVITYTTLTTGSPVCGDATCAELFVVSGAVMTNLHAGENVIAVEVHQSSSGSSDIVFGCGLTYSEPATTSPVLNILREGTQGTIYWNGSGFTLQQANFPNGPWSNVPGPVTTSAYSFTIPPGIKFYRLSN